MSTNDYGYRLIDADELGVDKDETPGVTAEEGTEETKEEEVTV